MLQSKHSYCQYQFLWQSPLWTFLWINEVCSPNENMKLPKVLMFTSNKNKYKCICRHLRFCMILVATLYFIYHHITTPFWIIMLLKFFKILQILHSKAPTDNRKYMQHFFKFLTDEFLCCQWKSILCVSTCEDFNLTTI